RFLSSFTALPVLRLKTPKNFPVSIFSLDRATLAQRRRRHDFDKANRRRQLAGRVQSSSGAVTDAPNPQALRSEHDLNLAILYAVQSGFRYSVSLLCLTCAADLLEIFAPGVQGNAAP